MIFQLKRVELALVEDHLVLQVQDALGRDQMDGSSEAFPLDDEVTLDGLALSFPLYHQVILLYISPWLPNNHQNNV